MSGGAGGQQSRSEPAGLAGEKAQLHGEGEADGAEEGGAGLSVPLHVDAGDGLSPTLPRAPPGLGSAGSGRSGPGRAPPQWSARRSVSVSAQM